MQLDHLTSLTPTRSLAGEGVALACSESGAGPALLLLHGFTGSAAGWAAHAAVFGRHFRTIAADLPGHGASGAPPDPACYGVERCAGELAALLDRLGIARAACLGYSMGGRIALAFALAHPNRVAALVLESASPGIADPAERWMRLAADAALADCLERDGIARFVDRWERQPLFASQKRLPGAARAALRAERLAQRPAGLANSLRGAGTGAQPSYWHRLHELAMPTLLLAGADDAKFVALARAMAAGIPAATLRIVPGAGHATHLENPQAFRRQVLGFLLAAASPSPARERARVREMR